MDPVSHVVMGRALVGAFERQTGSRFGLGVSAAAIIGSLIPDIDCLLMPAGWDVYLRVHQIGTHSLIGAVILGGLVGVLTGAIVRPRRRAGHSITVRYWRLAGAASLAALSHLLLDLLSGASVALAWPVSPRIFTLPLVAMADPFVIAILVLGALAMWRRRPQLQRSAIGVLVVASLLFVLKAALLSRLTSGIAGDRRFGADAPRALEARWGTWTEWNVFQHDDGALSAWRVNALSGAVIPLLRWPDRPESTLIHASRSLDTVQNFLRAHRLALAIERRQDDGRMEVLWSDVRYCWIRAQATDLQCALWFGGVFDRDDRPVRQVVHLGNWLQTRAP